MPPIFQHVITLIARILLSLVFIASGAGHVMDWTGATKHMAARGMAMEGVFGSAGTVLVHVMLAGTVVLLLLGGLSVLLGVRARWGAIALIVFLIPTTLIFHQFWTLGSSSPQHKVEMINFMKNAGLLGGLLMIAAFGSGGFSLDVFLPKRKRAGEL